MRSLEIPGEREKPGKMILELLPVLLRHHLPQVAEDAQGCVLDPLLPVETDPELHTKTLAAPNVARREDLAGRAQVTAIAGNIDHRAPGASGERVSEVTRLDLAQEKRLGVAIFDLRQVPDLADGLRLPGKDAPEPSLLMLEEVLEDRTPHLHLTGVDAAVPQRSERCGRELAVQHAKHRTGPAGARHAAESLLDRCFGHRDSGAEVAVKLPLTAPASVPGECVENRVDLVDVRRQELAHRTLANQVGRLVEDQFGCVHLFFLSL